MGIGMGKMMGAASEVRKDFLLFLEHEAEGCPLSKCQRKPPGALILNAGLFLS